MFLVHDLGLVAGYHPDSCRTGIPPRDDLYWRREERMLFNTTKMEKGCAVRAVRVRGRAWSHFFKLWPWNTESGIFWSFPRDRGRLTPGNWIRINFDAYDEVEVDRRGGLGDEVGSPCAMSSEYGCGMLWVKIQSHSKRTKTIGFWQLMVLNHPLSWTDAGCAQVICDSFQDICNQFTMPKDTGVLILPGCLSQDRWYCRLPSKCWQARFSMWTTPLVSKPGTGISMISRCFTYQKIEKNLLPNENSRGNRPRLEM